MKKHLWASLLLMLWVSLAEGQTSLFNQFTFTVDSTKDSLYFDTTFVVSLPSGEELGMIWGKARWDSLGGSFSDSSKMTVRELAYWIIADKAPPIDSISYYPLITSDGAVMDWQPVKIYDGSALWTNWTEAVGINDEDRFKFSWEMGERPWEYAIIKFEMWDSLAADPQGKWYFDFYCKKIH